MVSCTRRLTFEAGHRVNRHESKCRNLHGHSYKVIVQAEADQLDELGRVIDFSVLKERLGGWIDREWDHGFIIDKGDDEAWAALRAIDGQKVYLLPSNPTAENMALHLLNDVCPKLFEGCGIRIVRISVVETENCSAEATG